MGGLPYGLQFLQAPGAREEKEFAVLVIEVGEGITATRVDVFARARLEPEIIDPAGVQPRVRQDGGPTRLFRAAEEFVGQIPHDFEGELFAGEEDAHTHAEAVLFIQPGYFAGTG